MVSHKVLKEVAEERQRQDERWGEQNHHDGTGPNKLLFGFHAPENPTYLAARERATTITDSRTDMKMVSYGDILLEEVFEAMAESNQDRLREELVQVAAVTVAWIEKIDRDQLNIIPRSAEFLPGDLVQIHTTDPHCQEYNGRHGVVIYGPDDDQRTGWLVSSVPGSLRCLADELTMITRREDR